MRRSDVRTPRSRQARRRWRELPGGSLERARGSLGLPRGSSQMERGSLGRGGRRGRAARRSGRATGDVVPSRTVNREWGEYVAWSGDDLGQDVGAPASRTTLRAGHRRGLGGSRGIHIRRCRSLERRVGNSLPAWFNCCDGGVLEGAQDHHGNSEQVGRGCGPRLGGGRSVRGLRREQQHGRGRRRPGRRRGRGRHARRQPVVRRGCVELHHVGPVHRRSVVHRRRLLLGRGARLLGDLLHRVERLLLRSVRDAGHAVRDEQSVPAGPVLRAGAGHTAGRRHRGRRRHGQRGGRWRRDDR